MADAEGGINVHVLRDEEEALAQLGRPETTLANFLNSQDDFDG